MSRSFDVVMRSAVQTAAGALDYWRHPEQRAGWGGPFNGQRARRQLFESLVDHLCPTAIIETGTHRGTTTEFFASTGLPIFSIENNARLCGFARMRLAWRRNVNVRLGDSRAVLRRLFAGPLRRHSNGVVFAYLDAHSGGHQELPLAQELDLITIHCPKALVMIDDFCVPFDSGYGFDRYKSGLALTLEYLRPVMATHELAAWFPATPSNEETGVRRGCVVIAKAINHGAVLDSMTSLRRE